MKRRETKYFDSDVFFVEYIPMRYIYTLTVQNSSSILRENHREEKKNIHCNVDFNNFVSTYILMQCNIKGDSI